MGEMGGSCVKVYNGEIIRHQSTTTGIAKDAIFLIVVAVGRPLTVDKVTKNCTRPCLQESK